MRAKSVNRGITILYPGGFKPLHGGHLDLIKRYIQNPLVKEIKVIVGPKRRNGIDQELAFNIAKELTAHLPNVNIEKTDYPSPILSAYKIIEKLPPGNYALASSSKDDDYKRVEDFTNQHQPGEKYYDIIPKDVKIIKMPLDVNPKLFNTRTDDLNNTPIPGKSRKTPTSLTKQDKKVNNKYIIKNFIF